jgi:hypothetical protein
MDTIQDFSTPAGKSYLARLATLPPGQYRVSVVRYRRRRSDEQNRFLFGVVYPSLAVGIKDTWGETWDSEKIHFFCKCMFHFEPVTNHATGEVIHMPKRSRSMATDEFSNFIEQICRFAAEEFGVVVPEADPSFSPQPKPPTPPTVGASAN